MRLVKGTTIAQRLWRNVKQTESCWFWIGSTANKGYGQLEFRGKHHMVHRISYELKNGKIPEGLSIDHLCRVPRCVNPDHLEAVSTRENVLRGNAKAAINARKKFCIKGHPFDAENTGIRVDGRYCLTCSRESAKLRTKKNSKRG